MPDIQEAKCYEFTVQIGAPIGGGGQKKFRASCKSCPPPRFISVYALAAYPSSKSPNGPLMEMNRQILLQGHTITLYNNLSISHTAQPVALNGNYLVADQPLMNGEIRNSIK